MDTLKPLIRAAGETQRTIAIQLNVSEPSMSRWVTREVSIPLEYVTQLAEILGADVGTIVRLGLALPKERENAA